MSRPAPRSLCRFDSRIFRGAIFFAPSPAGGINFFCTTPSGRLGINFWCNFRECRTVACIQLRSLTAALNFSVRLALLLEKSKRNAGFLLLHDPPLLILVLLVIAWECFRLKFGLKRLCFDKEYLI